MSQICDHIFLSCQPRILIDFRWNEIVNMFHPKVYLYEYKSVKVPRKLFILSEGLYCDLIDFDPISELLRMS